MKCSICGRKLTNSYSKELGCGPVCYEKVFGNPAVSKKQNIKSGNGSSRKYEGGHGSTCLPGQMELQDYIAKQDIKEKESAFATLHQTTIV